MTILAPSFLDGSSFILAGYEDNYKSLDEYEFRSDPNTDYRVSCISGSGKIQIDLYWEECCDHSSLFSFDWIFFILAGNEDIKIQLDPTSDCGVSCPWASVKILIDIK